MLTLLVAVCSIMAATVPYESGSVTVNGTEIPYQVLLPQVETEEDVPLVVFLHGAGERGDDNEAQKRHFPERMAGEYARKYPCVVLAVQCPTGRSWARFNWSDASPEALQPQPTDEMRAVMDVIRHTVRTRRIDRSRIYLTGLSMGGFGTFDLAMRKPEWFACAVPICGGADPARVERLRGLPMRVYHGGADPVVPASRSRDVVEAADAKGIDIEYIEFEGVGHDSWTRAYTPEEALDWMFEQRREAPAILD